MTKYGDALSCDGLVLLFLVCVANGVDESVVFASSVDGVEQVVGARVLLAIGEEDQRSTATVSLSQLLNCAVVHRVEDRSTAFAIVRSSSGKCLSPLSKRSSPSMTAAADDVFSLVRRRWLPKQMLKTSSCGRRTVVQELFDVFAVTLDEFALAIACVDEQGLMTGAIRLPCRRRR